MLQMVTSSSYKDGYIVQLIVMYGGTDKYPLIWHAL